MENIFAGLIRSHMPELLQALRKAEETAGEQPGTGVEIFLLADGSTLTRAETDDAEEPENAVRLGSFAYGSAAERTEQSRSEARFRAMLENCAMILDHFH